MDKMEADNRRSIIEIRKRTDEKMTVMEEDFATTQNHIGNAAKKVADRTKAQREEEIYEPSVA